VILSNYHTHTIFCDGKDSPEELIQKAIELGCAEIGFSGHGYTDFDKRYCMSHKATEEYMETLLSLKEKYSGKLNVLIGVEQDYFSDTPTDCYDYVIGSVHYLKKGKEYLSIDESPEEFARIAQEYYGGDFYSLCEDYYALLAKLYAKTKCNIVGHFDLVTKYNEGNTFFDTSNPRYVNAAMLALSSLALTPALFEINTGAIARGRRTTPYPEQFLLDRMAKSRKPFVINSDCHGKDNLLCCFESVQNMLDEKGYPYVSLLSDYLN
jgi:histidinol-phosphatase (PHP family)